MVDLKQHILLQDKVDNYFIYNFLIHDLYFI